jgi:hypothetical protein
MLLDFNIEGKEFWLSLSARGGKMDLVKSPATCESRNEFFDPCNVMCMSWRVAVDKGHVYSSEAVAAVRPAEVLEGIGWND